MSNKAIVAQIKEMCRNLHINDICENASCEIKRCNQRHPRECRYYREYSRCKFNPCKFNHIIQTSQVSDIGNLMNEIKKCSDQLEVFESQIKMMEQNIIQKEEEINDLKKKNEIEEKSIPKKKNILQR